FYLAWQSWQESRRPANAPSVATAEVSPRFRQLFWRAFGLGASNP
ncbi:MAG TPA: LysE family translocator, partial [Pseudomonas sp.]|nr:LysE family translocator [Pseudomonas sp.]